MGGLVAVIVDGWAFEIVQVGRGRMGAAIDVRIYGASILTDVDMNRYRNVLRVRTERDQKKIASRKRFGIQRLVLSMGDVPLTFIGKLINWVQAGT